MGTPSGCAKRSGSRRKNSAMKSPKETENVTPDARSGRVVAVRPIPTLILVTGLPCTGKTTLARRLADGFSLPLLTKDPLKEILFDGLGWSNRNWSRRVSETTHALMYH